MGNNTAALASLDRAMTIRKRIVEADPRNVRVVELLLGDYARLADLQTSMGHPELANAALADAETLKTKADYRVPTSTGSRR